jgi:hypothetical protein
MSIDQSAVVDDVFGYPSYVLNTGTLSLIDNPLEDTLVLGIEQGIVG